MARASRRAKQIRQPLQKLQKLQRLCLAVAGVLVIAVLIMAGLSRSVVTRSRAEGSYTVVTNITETKYTDGDRVQYEYSFTPTQIKHAETLAFYSIHHEIQVYVGDECAYSLTPKDDAFSTVGGTWVTVPLYEEDDGKEVRVRLIPLYENYTTEAPELLLGSEVALHTATLHRSMPVLMLGMCVVFAGSLLICLALYHSIKGMATNRLYALGFLAIAAGLWRLSYDRVAYMLLPELAVLIYTISVVSLMVVALAMLNALETDEKGKKAIRICSCGYCAVYVLQLVLQITGVADLRQTLKCIHATIIISAVAFVVSAVRQWTLPREARREKGNFGWLLGLGVVIDLALYYIDVVSVSMVFTLVSILCYTILEGAQLLFGYMEQKNALAEMETQLTLSRTTTMMSQIRSHFVFNILNAISGMCKYDPERADDTVVRFARYLRNNIDIMEKDGNIPFVTDLRQVEDYVALEQVRFGDKLEFYTDVETDDFMIPPLILQPVVENAIKHGVSKKQGNGTIILRTRDAGDAVVITVEDDGVGFDMAELDKEKSVGVRNIRFRLEHLVHGTLSIQSELGKGTLVTITIPRD